MNKSLILYILNSLYNIGSHGYFNATEPLLLFSAYTAAPQVAIQGHE